jgi:hypothetical protein
MIRVGDFYGQILTVKEKAIKFAKEAWGIELTWQNGAYEYEALEAEAKQYVQVKFITLSRLAKHSILPFLLHNTVRTI